MMKCNYCSEYNQRDKYCPHCQFKYDNEFNLQNDDWDIFGLNDELEWSHLQILYRLHEQGIECLFADIWFNENIAYLIGVKSSSETVARALNIHKECIYDAQDEGLMIINLFQEKYIRGVL